MLQKNKIVLFKVLQEFGFSYIFLCDPDSFSSSNRIDVLIDDAEYSDVINKLKKHFSVFFLDDVCLYGLKRVFRVSSEKDYYFYSRPSIKSVDKMQWVPLNKNVESYFRSNSIKKNDLIFLSKESLYFYLICKNIFTNRKNGFYQEDANFIIKNNKCLSDATIINFFRCTFYNFTNELIRLISEKQLNKIFDEYISFAGY